MYTKKASARLPLWAGIGIMLTMGLLVAAETAFGAGPAPIGLGTAAPFAVLAGTPAVTNSGPTAITGDVGISPGAAVTGFPPGTVTGTIHTADAVALQAKTDLTAAYTVAAGLPVTATHGTLAGLTLPGGVYNAGGVTLDLTGTVTLDGQNDPSSVWVFQATSDLITSSSSTVALINGASPCNVFWQVTSSATLGSGSTFVGTIMALTSITMADGVTVTGRALARNGDVTLINDVINASTCAAPAATGTPAASAASSASAAPAASAVSSGVPNTAFQGDEPGASWPVFVAIILSGLLLALVVFRTTLAAERLDKD
jgi:type VI secretion system secreted protein VgrG